MEYRNNSPHGRRLARLLWPAGILAALMLSLLLAASPWSPAEAEKSAPAGPPPGLPVEAVEVTIAPATRELSAVGTLQSNESVVIATGHRLRPAPARRWPDPSVELPPA